MLSLSVLELSIWSKYMEGNVQVTKQPLPQLTKEMFGHHCLMPLQPTTQPSVTAPCYHRTVPFDLAPP